MMIKLFFPGRIRTYETGFCPGSSFEGEELVAERNSAGDTITLYARVGFSNSLESRAALRKQLPNNYTYTLQDAVRTARNATHALSHAHDYAPGPSGSQGGSSNAKKLGEVMTVKNTALGNPSPTIADVCRLAHEQFELLRLDLDGETLWEDGVKGTDFVY